MQVYKLNVPIIAQLVLEEPLLLTYRMEQVEIYTMY